MTNDVKRPRGRPRDEAATRSIHRAALDLLKEAGYGALTIDGIARRAGVGRQTIYRWWPSIADVVLDALNTRADTDISADDLPGFVRITFSKAPDYVAILSGLMAQAQLDPEFAVRFQAGFLDRRRTALRTIVERELPGADPEFAADLVFGPLWYLVLTRPAALTAQYADRVLAMVRASAQDTGR